MPRRRIAAFALSLLAAVALAPVHATPLPQAEPSVALSLVGQSIWNGPKQPLELSFRAANGGTEDLDQLSVALTIFAPARSRSVYELSLTSDYTSPIFTYPFPQEGTLPARATRTFRIQQPLDVVAARNESAIFPLKVELRSRDRPVGELRTPMIYLSEPPKVPLNLTWTFVVSSPLQLDAAGVLQPGPLEAELKPGGRLDALARSLAHRDPAPVTMAVSPVLLTQLTHMAQGYRRLVGGEAVEVPEGSAGAADAARVLRTLREAARRPETEVVALPFGDASIPALFRAGLGADLPRLIGRGRLVVRQILDAPVSTEAFRPPFSQLDDGSLRKLLDHGVHSVLLQPGDLPTPPGLKFSPPPIARMTPEGDPPIWGVVPDEGVAARSLAFPEDPTLAARAALGELAAMWFEFPGTPGRGAAVLLPESSPHAATFYLALSNMVRGSPWLAPTKAAAMHDRIDEISRATLSPRTYPTLPASYVRALAAARASVERFRAAVPEAKEAAEGFETDLLLCEGSTFISRPDLGLGYITSVRDRIRTTYDSVHLDTTTFTLAAGTGVLPVIVRNDSPFTMVGQIRLIADRRLSFLGGSERGLELAAGAQSQVTFQVRAQTTGRVPLKIQIQTPTVAERSETIAEVQTVVRSTAYNRVALFLTVGAALFLVGWWARRFLPRRTS